MKPLNGAPVFSAGESQYYWEDVLLAAIRRGDWPGLEGRVQEELAALRWQRETGTPATQASIETAAAEFRYARGLVSADEMRAWLRDWGLSVAEWMDWVRRDHARTLASSALDAITVDYAPTSAEIAGALPTTFICSEIAADFARELAERAAVSTVERWNGGTAERNSIGATDTLEVLSCFGSVTTERLHERGAVVGQLDDALAPVRQAVLTPGALHRELDAHHLDWIRVEYRSVAFANEHAAREASWCVRSDGLGLDEVAARAGATISTGSRFLCDVDGELRTTLLGARAGELIGPSRENDCFVLYAIDLKQLPSLEDPEMRQRVEDQVVQRALASAVHDRVRWQVAL